MEVYPRDRLLEMEDVHFGERVFIIGVEDRDIHVHQGLSALGGFCAPRLWDLYRKILKYI